MILIGNENVSPPADEVLDAGHIRSKRISATFSATAVLALTVSRNKDIFFARRYPAPSTSCSSSAPGSGREDEGSAPLLSGLKDFIRLGWARSPPQVQQSRSL